MPVRASRRRGCIVLTATGGLDQPLADELRNAVAGVLVHQPAGLICDLAAVTADNVRIRVFSAIADLGRAWPETPVVLAAAEQTLAARLRRLGLDNHLGMYETVHRAVAEILRRPAAPTERVSVAPRPHAARTARSYIDELCRRWSVDELAAEAAVVVTELVNDAIQRGAGAELELRASLTLRGLRLALRSGRPRREYIPLDLDLPKQLTDMTATRMLAASWGALPTKDGGQIAWCLLRRPDEHHRPATRLRPEAYLRHRRRTKERS